MYLNIVRQSEKIGEFGDNRLGRHVSAGEDAVAFQSNSNGVGAEADAPLEALRYRHDQDPLRLGSLVFVNQNRFCST